MFSKPRHSQLALGVVAGGFVVAYVGAKLAKSAVKDTIRKMASCPFEYQIALHHVATGSGEYLCTLVKVPKTADFAGLKRAVSEALGVGVPEVDGLQLYPLLRGGYQPELGLALSESSGMASFETLLAQQPSDNLQVVELLCLRQGSEKPAALPMPPSPFPAPGPTLPFIGNAYIGFGSEPLFSYNITKKVFPPDAPKYPYGATVRSNAGRQAKINDFPEGTVFHDEAGRHTILSADAHLVEEILARKDEFPKLWNRDSQVLLQSFTGNGLFTSSETSEDWQTAHSILPRGFNQIKVKSFAPTILAKTRVFIREWSAFPAGHTVQDVNHWLTAMTADAVVACSMGLEMHNVERMGDGRPAHPFLEHFRFGLGYTTGGITTKSEYGLARFIPGFGAGAKLQARFDAARAGLDELVEKVVEQTRSGELGDQHSVIRAMLEDKGNGGNYVRYGALYGHIVNLMIAGHETTAATLSFTMAFLAQYPEYEARAYDEVKRVLQGRTEPAADDVPKLQFVEQCFREALRLYSPVTGLSRDAAYDTLLQGRRVFQGERIIVLTRALHTNPEYWGGEFGDPLTFNPDRFSPEAVKKRHPNAYHPWGFGSRACIGSQFALFEAKTFLASMLIHFKIAPVPGYEIKASLEAGSTPSAHRLELRVFPRPGGPLCGPGGEMMRLPSTAAEASAAEGKRALVKNEPLSQAKGGA